nr:reverse transcriptase domain-containing protein [Tanacetum cinerariifolium]
MTLELADRSITSPVGIAEDVYVKVGSFHFPADFVVVDFDADPRVPLILGRSFLKTGKALIDVFEGELTLRVGKESITFNLDQTSRYFANYNDMTAKRIDVIDVACEEYSQEVLGFSNTISSGNPTPFYDPIVSTTSPTLTPFGNSDFLLEEVDAFLAVEDEPTSSNYYQSYLDPEGDILLLEAFLNYDPSLPPYQGNYMLEVCKELKICEAHSEKSSVDELHVAELKELPPHLEYAFLEALMGAGGVTTKAFISFKDFLKRLIRISNLSSREMAICWNSKELKGEEDGRGAFVLTLESVTRLREYLTLDLLSIIAKPSRGILSKKLPHAGGKSWFMNFEQGLPMLGSNEEATYRAKSGLRLQEKIEKAKA